MKVILAITLLDFAGQAWANIINLEPGTSAVIEASTNSTQVFCGSASNQSTQSSIEEDWRPFCRTESTLRDGYWVYEGSSHGYGPFGSMEAAAKFTKTLRANGNCR